MTAFTPERRRLRSSSSTAIVIALVVTLGLTGLLYARVALTKVPEPRSPLTVSAVPYQLQESYQRPVSYLGLVVAGRKAKLGFEVPGQIAVMGVREGHPVSKGQVIASLDDAALRAKRQAAAAELEQTRVELEQATLKSQRQRNLQASGAVSKEAYDDTRLRARALTSRVDAVAARLSGIDIELEKSKLVAPYDGIIAERLVYEGSVVSPGVPVVRLIETAGQEAHIGIPVALSSTLQSGRSYRLSLRDSWVEASLLAIRPDVDPITRTTTAVFAMPAEIMALDGEPITLELEEPVDLTGGWLPLTALLEGRRGVWTVLRLEAEAGDNHRTVREVVEVLDLSADQAYVRGTLMSGARVVASGVHRITPGALVTAPIIN
jgi:RND family efflux transporter MFP subunit